jgi:hypothetical protein
MWRKNLEKSDINRIFEWDYDGETHIFWIGLNGLVSWGKILKLKETKAFFYIFFTKTKWSSS